MNYPKLPSFRLDGKRALVTGAGRGIGWSFMPMWFSFCCFKGNREFN